MLVNGVELVDRVELSYPDHRWRPSLREESVSKDKQGNSSGTITNR